MNAMLWSRRLLACALFVAGCVFSAHAQLPSAPQPQPSAGQPPPSSQPAADRQSAPPAASDQQSSADQGSQPQSSDEKKPGRLKRAWERAKPNCANIGGTESCWGKEDTANQKPGSHSQDTDSQFPANEAPPRSSTPAGESSSRDTQIDISPPPGDVNHEDADVSDVNEFHSYDPHRAAKDVEVGDFYFHKKDYRAAESRYAGALQWKPGDAVATFRLAQAEEKLGKAADATKNYQAYLKLLPDGEFSKEAKAALERLSK